MTQKDRFFIGLVLVVDDNLDNLDMIASHLHNMSYQVITTQDGQNGLQLAEQEQPDAILLDVIMPSLSGFEVCRCLKINSLTRDIPVIFMTVLTDLDDIKRGFEVGGTDYITKPIYFKELTMRLGIHVQTRKKIRKLEQEKADLEAELRALRTTDEHK